MVVCMKTTLVIDDALMRRVKAEAARDGRTMSEIVEAALRLFFERRTESASDLPELPAFRSRAFVDVADREALYGAMEGR